MQPDAQAVIGSLAAAGRKGLDGRPQADAATTVS